MIMENPTDTNPEEFDDSTPLIQEEQFPTPDVHVLSNSSQVMVEDNKFFNFMLMKLGEKWEQSSMLDSDQICRLVATTTKTLQVRREMMLMPTKASQGKFSSDEEDYDAFDD